MKKIAPLFLIFAGFSFLCRSQSGTQITNFNTGTAFSCITKDTSGNIWAGTNKKGCFYLNKKMDPHLPAFEVFPSDKIGSYVIQSIAADSIGNIWIGHAGYGNLSAIDGGVERININTSGVKSYTPEKNKECIGQTDLRHGLATLNVTSVTVDKFNTVWTAHRHHQLLEGSNSYFMPGSFSRKPCNVDIFDTHSNWTDLLNGNEDPRFPYTAYNCNAPADKTPGGRNCSAVACNKSEVWIGVQGYEYATERNFFNQTKNSAYLPARVMIYDLNGLYKNELTVQDLGISLGTVNSIYLSQRNDHAWVGSTAAGKGFSVRIKGCWKNLNEQNLSAIYPAGASINSNAIWGNRTGQVFIGTNKGLLIYNGTGKIDDATSYTLYTTGNSDIASNNILGGVNDYDSIQWVATDAGISRIVSDNKFSLDPTAFSCNDPHINAIELQTSQDLTGRTDFHNYIIETVVCDQNGPNGSNCNAQYVFNRMQEDMSLQVPNPRAFPQDNLKMNMLLNLTEEEQRIIVENVNKWTKTAEGNEFSGIKYIRDVLTSDLILKYYCTGAVPLIGCFWGDGQLPFGIGSLLTPSLEQCVEQQNLYNGFGLIDQNCEKIYRLYNPPNLIMDRILYKNSSDILFCGGKLNSTEWDPVKVFIDRKNLTMTNYTMPGHFLHPGKIERSVVEECGKVKVITVGTGLNYCADSAPEFLSEAQRQLYNTLYGSIYGPIPVGGVLTVAQKLVFAKLAQLSAQMNGIGNVILGSITFKNIDLQIKKKLFE